METRPWYGNIRGHLLPSTDSDMSRHSPLFHNADILDKTRFLRATCRKCTTGAEAEALHRHSVIEVDRHVKNVHIKYATRCCDETLLLLHAQTVLLQADKGFSRGFKM